MVKSMIDFNDLRNASRTICNSAPLEFRNKLLRQLEKATFYPINNDGSIVELRYGGYQRPDYSQNQVGPVGLLKDTDLCPIELIMYWDRNLKLCEIELIRQGEGPLIAPDFTFLELIK